MSFGKIYLDSNVLISAFGREENHEAAARMLTIVSAIGTNGIAPFVTSELCLSEMLVRPFRERNRADISGVSALIDSRGWLAVKNVSRDVLWGAALLRSQYAHLKLPDAIHVSTALLSDCTHFLTADLRLRETYGSLDADFGDWPGRSKVEVIRPTLDVLDSIISWLHS